MSTAIRPVRPVPAGAWIRERFLPHPAGSGGKAREAEWNKLWHIATGDIQWRPLWWNGRALTRCGYAMTMEWCFLDGSPANEIVIADDDPGVETCSKCRVRAAA